MKVKHPDMFSVPPARASGFEEHNQEQEAVWKAFYSGRPLRVPMLLGINPRILLCEPVYNTRGISFRDYMSDPELMLRVQCEFAYFSRHFLRYDQPMGMPDRWTVSPDTQNIAEAAWLGAEIVYINGEVPDTVPPLRGDRKNALFEQGIPDPFSSIFGMIREYGEYFSDGSHQFMDRPVECGLTGLGTDGPMTIACSLRGACEFCIDLYMDPEYALKLLDFITEATIARVKAWRKYYLLETPDSFAFADDSISLLSAGDYERLILPFHLRLIRELTSGKGENSIHLCGDAARHFPLIRDKLNVTGFDTGFPIDHGELVQTLGPKVTVQGGPRAELLRNGAPEEITAETKRILDAVKPHTGRFILREANNLPPGTPLANINAMYEAVRLYGKFK